MDSLKLLEALCKRHQLPLEEARALEPLVLRAIEASGEERRRILEVLDATLKQRRVDLEKERAVRASRTDDERLLQQVARMLHAWGT